ncbi:MAG: isoprenylcysteine carboxylmethyltransferase family protein [Acidobacteriota bacterium]
MTSSDRLLVWTGGGVFVGSLVICAYSYIVSWAVPREIDWPAGGFDAVVFSVFALHHSLFARTRVKERLARLIPPHLLRSVYVWIASLLLIAVCVVWQPVGGLWYRHAGGIAAAHFAIQLLGLGIVAQSVRAIDPLELAGIRSQSTTARLQMAGPYRLVRHPLYLGWILIVFGAARMTGDRLVFAAITTLYLAAAIPWEEASLHAAFGSDYERYRRHVRWRMIPFIY